MKDFLEHFMFKGGKIGLAIGHPSRLTLHSSLPTTLDMNTDVYFTPALRNGGEDSMGKAGVIGTRVVWADVDDERLPRTTFPPSIVVHSGHGHHLYWSLNKVLTSPDAIEAINKALISDIPTADKASWNVNRVLRVPGTINSKKPLSDVKLLRTNSDIHYTIQDFNVLAALDRKARHKIKTGDRRGYKSRSERDWAVVTALVQAGASDELIGLLFLTQPVGDKVRDSSTHENYFRITLERARSSNAVKISQQDFVEDDDGYYVHTRRGKRRVSTFIITPKLLLDGSGFGAEDAIVGDVTASEYVWENITFSRGAFTSVRKMDAEAPVAAWQWLGNDTDVRKLLPFLMEDLVGNGLPRVAASPVIGLHFIKDKPYFVGHDQTLTDDQLWNGYGGPIAWLPNRREHPKLQLSPRKPTKKQLATIGSSIPALNHSQSIWPMVGWYASASLKPWLETEGYRFPTLNVTGSRGSGKTTLIQRVMMPLFGQVDPKSYDAGTTRFVTLSLLGSSNAVPIAFSEFRYESVERFLRFVLLSYDTGHDPRGRPDQTTVDYPLMAPFSLDGEDIITDPAARQRIVVVLLTTKTIDEGSDAYRAYKALKIPPSFGGYYMQSVLQRLVKGELRRVLSSARKAMFEAFPSKLPDRVRNNHIVAYFGVKLWCDVVGMDPPPASVMERSITTVYNTEVGRGRMLVDDLVEDVVNGAAASEHRFKWDYDEGSNILYFQMATAHAWWVEKRRRQGRGSLERDSLRQQMKEVSFARKPSIRKGVWMFGVHLPSALEADLDVPKRINVKEITVRF